MSDGDDLFPLEGPEDWTTPIQRPQSAELQKCGVSLVLSQETQYEYKITTHSAKELRDLSRTTNRMEIRDKGDFTSVSSMETDFMQTFLQQMSASSKL